MRYAITHRKFRGADFVSFRPECRGLSGRGWRVFTEFVGIVRQPTIMRFMPWLRLTKTGGLALLPFCLTLLFQKLKVAALDQIAPVKLCPL